MGLVSIPSRAKKLFLSSVQEILHSGNLAEGEWNKKLGELVKLKNNSQHCIPVSSNGTGMMAVLHALKDLDGRKYAILQGNTMYGVKTTIQSAGYEVVSYLDCSLKTLMPTIDDVSQAFDLCDDLSQCVLVLSQLGGWVNPDIEKIAELCDKLDVPLVEDCAHSVGAKIVNGKSSGNYGIAGVFSFYSTKAIPGGEGGAIVTNSTVLADYLKLYVMYDRFNRKMDFGCNFRLSELQALFLFSVLTCENEIITDKRNYVDEYKSICEQKGIQYINEKELGSTSNYYKFVITDSNPDSPVLKMKNVTSPIYNYFIDKSVESFPGVRQIVSQHICLPTWFDMSNEMFDATIKELKSL